MKDALVLVTGGAAGIGRAIVEAVVAAGARALVWDVKRPASEAQSTLDGRARMACVDVSDGAAVERAAADAAIAGWAPTHLVNNAGIVGKRMALETPDATEIDRVLAVNVRGAFLATGAFLKTRAPHTGAAIVNMASIAGTNGGAPGNAAYGASKGALMAMTRAMARDLAPDIRVNALSPGIIDTDIQRHVFVSREDMERRAASIPLRRIGTVGEVAEAALWLLFAAPYITGEVINVAGGRK